MKFLFIVFIWLNVTVFSFDANYSTLSNAVNGAFNGLSCESSAVNGASNSCASDAETDASGDDIGRSYPQKFRQGDLFYAKLSPGIGDEIEKKRPVVIIQGDRLTNLDPGTVLVSPTSSDLRERAIEKLGIKLLRIPARAGLEYESIILTTQLRAISPLRMERKLLTHLTPEEWVYVQRGILQMIELKNSQPQDGKDEIDDHTSDAFMMVKAIVTTFIYTFIYQ